MAQTGEIDPRIPDTSTAWQLWYGDMFDRESSPSLETSGTDIVRGLYELWRHTLQEAIQENGSATFSRFYLTWGNTAAERVDVLVEPFNNLSLLKLRQWTGLDSRQAEGEDSQRLMRLAILHADLLKQSRRWQAPAIDWSAESRELLARLEAMEGPEDL